MLSRLLLMLMHNHTKPLPKQKRLALLGYFGYNAMP